MTQVAVYGSLRQGMGNNRRLGKAQFLGTTVTVQPYTMYSLGGFPMVRLGLPNVPIVVEIYECDEAVMEDLDYLEGYRGEGRNNFYDRSEIEVEGFGTALIYHIEGERENAYAPIVESGDWVQHYEQMRKQL